MNDGRILYESHMHTPLCKHAVGEPEAYAAVAIERGLAGITVTCHNPMPNGYSAGARMREEQWPEYLACVERARVAYAGKIDVRLGLECDYYPGAEPWLEKQIGGTKLSHVLGSIHPQVGEYIANYWKGDAFAYQQVYFDHLACAAESGLFDTLSHPDLVKNQTKDEWQLERIWPHVLKSLDRIARTGVAMELNTSGMNKAIPEMNPGPRILVAMRERRIPVVVGADAHEPGRCGDGFLKALGMLEEAGFEKVSFFVERKRRDVGIGEAKRSVRF